MRGPNRRKAVNNKMPKKVKIAVREKKAYMIELEKISGWPFLQNKDWKT